MVNVTNRPNIHVRLAAVKFLFRHCLKLLIFKCQYLPDYFNLVVIPNITSENELNAVAFTANQVATNFTCAVAQRAFQHEFVVRRHYLLATLPCTLATISSATARGASS
jgi:hypothetical protein